MCIRSTCRGGLGSCWRQVSSCLPKRTFLVDLCFHHKVINKSIRNSNVFSRVRFEIKMHFDSSPFIYFQGHCRIWGRLAHIHAYRLHMYIQYTHIGCACTLTHSVNHSFIGSAIQSMSQSPNQLSYGSLYRLHMYTQPLHAHRLRMYPQPFSQSPIHWISQSVYESLLQSTSLRIFV